MGPASRRRRPPRPSPHAGARRSGVALVTLTLVTGALVTGALCLAPAAATAWDWPQPLRKDGKWFAPINIGVGPGVTMLPGVLSGFPATSLTFDAFGIVHPKIIAYQVKANRRRVPPKYRGCLNLLNTTSPWHIKAGPAQYLPTTLVVAPANPLTGSDRFAFGVLSEPLLGGIGFGQGGNHEPLYMKLTLGLPTVSYLYVSHPALKEASHIFGIGARLKWQLTWQPSDRLAFTLQWSSHLQWTNAYATVAPHDEARLGWGSSSVQLWDANHERAWHVGTLSLIINWRMPYYAGGM